MAEVNGAFVENMISSAGKRMKIAGWIVIVLSFPLMLIFVGFVMLPLGIFMVWRSNKIIKNSGAIVSGAAQGIANLGKTFNGK